MKPRNLFLIGAAAGATIGGLTWLAVRRVTAPVEAEPIQLGEPFPTVTGRLLDGRALTLPDDALGSVALLIVAWDYDARKQVQGWAEAAMAAFGEQRNYLMLQVALINGMGPVMRRVVDMSMARNTPEPERSHVLTVYGDLREVIARLSGDPKEAHVFVLGRTGRITWRTGGAVNPDNLVALHEALRTQGVESV